jgi:hypothetical protein
MNRLWITFVTAPVLWAGVIPAGTEISLRLSTKIATETAAVGNDIRASVIAPVIVDGNTALPSGTTISGSIKQTRAASEKERALLELTFANIESGNYKTEVSAVVSSVENAREVLDDAGVINGIEPSQTYSARIDQGIAKLGANERFAALAAIIQGTKEALKIEDANANIDYDAGVELNIRLTAPLDWKGPVNGPESKLHSFPDEKAVMTLVNSQPYRTVAEKPPNPSDITNIMFIGTETQLRAAFGKAGWSEPAKLDAQSKLETARALIEARGYKEGPISVLLLEGKPPAMAFQKGNNTFGKRHHLRIFLRPATFAGKPVWVCSSTHDINIEFSDRDRTFIHKVEPQIDRERAKVVNDLIFAGAVNAVALVDRPDVPTEVANATGDTLQTDGRMAVLLLQ